MSLETILQQLKATPGKLITLKTGEKKMVYERPATAEFWELRKRSADHLKEHGLSCSKYNGQWKMTLWENFDLTPRIKVEPIPEVKPVDLSVLAQLKETNLYDYQQAHAARLVVALQQYNVALDSSSTGTGKTFTALNVAKVLGKRVYIICPKPTIYGWIKSAAAIGVQVEGIANYELARLGKKLVEKQTKKGLRFTSIKSNNFADTTTIVYGKPKKVFGAAFPSNVLVIFDEVHRCKSHKTQNSQLLIACKEAKAQILMLSATPAESPLHFYSIGYALGLFPAPMNMWSWSENYNCRKDRFGWQFHGGRYEMKHIREEIGDRMDGMDVNELIQAGKFPETKIIAEVMYMNSTTDKINKYYEEWTAGLNEWNAMKEDLKQKLDSTHNPLALRQKFHQLIEMEKCPYVAEMAEDALNEGKSVAIFCNYTATIHQLMEGLKAWKPVQYNGEQTSYENEAARVAFFDNKTQLIIGNIAAMREGIDLHDLSGEHERFAILFPAPYAQGFKQALGRVHRAGGHYSIQKIAFCAGTVEETIADRVMEKIGNLDELVNIDTIIMGGN